MELAVEWNKKEHGCELIVKARITDLAGVIFQYVPMESFTEGERNNQKAAIKRIIDVFKFIESAYQTEIPLKKAAEVSGFSIFHFSRLFKEVAGLSFVDYLTQFRINKALHLLQHTEEKIADIAHKTGFKSIQTFNRVFKEVMNRIPSEYRSKK